VEFSPPQWGVVPTKFPIMRFVLDGAKVTPTLRSVEKDRSHTTCAPNLGLIGTFAPQVFNKDVCFGVFLPQVEVSNNGPSAGPSLID
jgi:hypothetical protein